MKLTAKQARFVEEYCVDFNASKAAERAGYSSRTAYSIGQENTQKPAIAAAIETRLDRLAMGAAEATKRMADYARGGLRPFFVEDSDGNLHLSLSTAEAKANLHLLKKVKQREVVLKQEGEELVLKRSFEIETYDAKDAVEKILKLHGKFVEKHQHTGAADGPLEIVIVSE